MKTLEKVLHNLPTLLVRVCENKVAEVLDDSVMVVRERVQLKILPAAASRAKTKAKCAPVFR